MKHAETCERNHDRELGECSCGAAELAEERRQLAALTESYAKLADERAALRKATDKMRRACNGTLNAVPCRDLCRDALSALDADLAASAARWQP